MIIDASREFDVGRFYTQWPTGAFDLVLSGLAEIARREVDLGQCRLLEFKLSPVRETHAIADQRTGGADFKAIAARLLDRNVFDGEARTVFVFVGEVAFVDLVDV